MLPIGISTCGKTPDEKLFSAYAAAGIAAAELSPDDGDYDALDYPAAKKAADAAGVALWSFHLQFCPFSALDPSSPDAEKRLFTVNRLSEQIRRAAGIGIPKYVLHASAEPIADAERAQRMACAMESISVLSGVAAACGGTLCVENLPRTCIGRDSEEILRLLSVSPAVRACFDTNHLLKEPIAGFIAAVGEKIATVHVSDYDFIDEKHWLPGEGGIDWAALYAALRQTGYDGVWMYELGFSPKASMPRARDLTPADFARNADEIFTGKFPLTRVPRTGAANEE